MTWGDAAVALAAAAAGWITACLTLPRLARLAPPALVRANVSGRDVAAVGGAPLFLGGVAGLGVVSVVEVFGAVDMPTSMLLAVAAVLGAMFVAGWWDDTRGDERPRGFKGHLRAGRGGRITGGIVKMVAGTAGGLGAGFIISTGLTAVEIGLLIALTANLFNLLDRAPGRAGKVGVAAMVLLAVSAPWPWLVASAGTWGALALILPADLREQVMLGDSGANPLGAVAGLGVALSLGETGRWVAIALLVLATAASEVWSFSAFIDRVRVLRFFDRIGRQDVRDQ